MQGRQKLPRQPLDPYDAHVDARGCGGQRQADVVVPMQIAVKCAAAGSAGLCLPKKLNRLASALGGNRSAPVYGVARYIVAAPNQRV